MKNRSLQVIAVNQDAPVGLPSLGELAALRAWYEGVSSREAVDRYLGAQRTKGESSRGVIRRIRHALIAFARTRHHAALVELLDHPDSKRATLFRKVFQAIDYLRSAPVPEPMVTDDIGKWFPARTCQALQAYGIRTLADLTVRVPRRRMWWVGIDGSQAY